MKTQKPSSLKKKPLVKNGSSQNSSSSDHDPDILTLVKEGKSSIFYDIYLKITVKIFF